MDIRIDLAGEWVLENSHFSVPAEVPGDTHSALLKAGKIPDPYWGTNELDIQHLGRVDWEYSRSFLVAPELLESPSVYLNIDQLDTVATVYINDRKAGSTNNAFLRYRFEIKHLLSGGENSIRIVIQSPENVALAERARLPYPAPHNNSPVQSPGRNLIRKPQCHGGWDWGICMMVSAVGPDIYIEATSVARIESVQCRQVHAADHVEVTIVSEIHAVKDGTTPLSIQFGEMSVSTSVDLQRGSTIIEHTFQVDSPRLWWPNGYGEQFLYPLIVSVGGSSIQKRIGLRQLEVHHEADAHGYSMTLWVNNLPVFCKGANWIPADAFPQRQTRSVIKDLLESARSANMNMIRVWGGGQYESDYFYDLCDELGLLIWQDFMFACSVYPATPAFLDLARREAEYQVKRLQCHPSLALWCGNNENLGALNWYKETRENRDRYVVDYDRLNEGVLGKTIRELDPTRVFWPSSPCGGPNDYSDCWHDDTRGDMHYWSVWFEDKPFEAVHDIKPRFCSEFGFQSFPSLETVRTYAAPDQWNVTSPVLEHHQRSESGNTTIIRFFARYFRMPNGFENFLYLSQVQQAVAIKTAIEHFRRIRPVCMGAVYWQLNDLWPVCSWSSLEYGGKWKLLHYAAKRFFAPLLISAAPTDDNGLAVWVNQDGGSEQSGKAVIQVVSLTGEIRKTIEEAIVIPANNAICIGRFPIEDLTDDTSNTFLYLRLEVGEVQITNDHLFAAYKNYGLLRTEIELDISAADDGLIYVTARSMYPAFWVTLSARNIRGEFDDNGFLLLPSQPKTVAFRPKQDVSLEQFRSSLSVTHLRDTYE